MSIRVLGHGVRFHRLFGFHCNDCGLDEWFESCVKTAGDTLEAMARAHMDECPGHHSRGLPDIQGVIDWLDPFKSQAVAAQDFERAALCMNAQRLLRLLRGDDLSNQGETR